MYIINKHYLVNLKWEFSKGKVNLAQHFRKKRESDIYNPIHIYIKNQWSNHLALLPNSKFKSTLEDESLPPKKKIWMKRRREERRKHEDKNDTRLNNKKNKTNCVWSTSRVPNYFEIMLTSQKPFSIPII